MNPGLWWLTALLLSPAPAAASATPTSPAPISPAPPSPVKRFPPLGDCHDDDMVDRCSPEQQRRVRELFGVKSIEAHREAGDQVRRAFYVDGYGRDVVAIAFVRPKGGDPQLWVHFPREGDGRRSEPLRAPVPQEVWDAVIERSGHFDRRLEPLPRLGSGSDDIVICMHSWVYTVEATDPPQSEDDTATVRRRTEDACDDGLAEAYAGELQRAAVPLLPPCARLDPRQHRNPASLLSACRLLAGDRLAAAAVLNRAHRFHAISEAEDVGHLDGLFGYEAIVDWQGERNAGTGTAAKFWTGKVLEKGHANFFYEAIEGKSPDRVQLRGLLVRSIAAPEGGESVYEQARVEQIWTDEQGDFTVRSVTVGPFERRPDKSDRAAAQRP